MTDPHHTVPPSHPPNSDIVSGRLSSRDLVLCLCGLLTVAAGVTADGMISVRNTDPAALTAGAARLERLPATIGEWTSVPGSIDERERRVAEITGAVRREYRHRLTGYVVSLSILSGAAGPMCVHPPTACFEGIGYSLCAGPQVVAPTGKDGERVSLNKASFRQNNSSLPEVVRVFWGWSTAGQWDAPANPRLVFRGEPNLYKLYLTDRALESRNDIPQAESFLEDALPVIRQALSGAGPNRDAGT